MDRNTLIDFRNIFSTVEFSDGNSMPGLIVSLFDLLLETEEFRFVPQSRMHAYKAAFDRFERETCEKLSFKILPEQVRDIRTVSLGDYKKALEEKEELTLVNANYVSATVR